jgi:hypothetical protein
MNIKPFIQKHEKPGGNGWKKITKMRRVSG